MHHLPVSYGEQNLPEDGGSDAPIGMGNPADRWRVIAYVRTLQLSQKVPAAQLSGEAQAQLKAGGKK